MNPASLGKDPPVFIVGTTRSGSTLLQVMLDRHPDLAIPGESHFIPILWARRRRYGEVDRLTRLHLFLKDLGADPIFREWGFPIELVQAELAANTTPTFAEAIEGIYRAHARWRGKSRWGDKTPQYVGHLPLLSDLFPNAKFVHLIRDGRDVALSVLALNRLHRRAASVGFSWAREVRRGRTDGRALGSGKYLEVRYENLLEAPDVQLKRICGFLELPYDAAMLVPGEADIERIPSRFRTLHARAVQPPTKGLRDWRTQLPASEIADFEAVAGQILKASGYDLTTHRRPTTLARAWLRVAWFVVRSTIPRLGSRIRRQRKTRQTRVIADEQHVGV